MMMVTQRLLICAMALSGAVAFGETQQDMRVSADEALQEADAALNSAYKDLMQVLEAPQQEAVREGQRAWIRYRDACVASEGALYEGGSLQPTAELRCAHALTREQTARLRALMPETVALKRDAMPSLEVLSAAREQAQSGMQKVYAAYNRESENPEVKAAQQAWERFCDLWITAELSCYPEDAAPSVEAGSRAELFLARTTRLKELFMEGYREEDAPAAHADEDISMMDPPLLQAASAGDVEAVQRLLARGANVNEVNDADWSALHVAAEEGNLALARVLLQAGARTDLYDFDGRSAADIAREVGHVKLAEMLEQQETKPPEGGMKKADTPKNEASIQDLASLLRYFGDLSDLRQEAWNSDNAWKYTVGGSGVVEAVNRVTLFSEITSAEYEITVELPGGDRAVLYLPRERRDDALALDIGDPVNFTGQLKSINDWGFWRSGYVLVH